MNKIKIVSVLLFISAVFISNCTAQLLETRHIIGVTGGYGSLSGSGSDNMFFPSGVDQSGYSIDISYEHKVYSWLSGGAALGYYKFNDPSETGGFAQIVSNGGDLICIGPQVNMHSPFKSIGWLNRMRLGIALAPQIHFYSGERTVYIENVIVPLNLESPSKPVLYMTDSSRGFSLKISPEVYMRVSQRIGVKLSYMIQFSDIFTGYDNESVFTKSLMGGLIITLGNDRHIF
nr:hypothetical protein [uncultured Carboxylicivirga sp.]